MTNVSTRSASDGIFALISNPERVELTKPRSDVTLSGLKFSNNNDNAPTSAAVAAAHTPRASQHSPFSRPHCAASSPPAASSPAKAAADTVGRWGATEHCDIEAHTPSPGGRSNHSCNRTTKRNFFDETNSPRQQPPDHRGDSPSSPLFGHNIVSPLAANDAGGDHILEKQSVLMELNRLKQAGAKLTKEYSVRDNLSDMQFEVRCQLAQVDEANMVKFMSDGMKLACQGVELANTKFGPFLELDGWAAAATTDMSRYDSALSKLYRKYWTRSTMGPEMELAFALIGSVTMFHFKKKASGVFFDEGKKPVDAPEHTGPTATPFPTRDQRPPAIPRPSTTSIITPLPPSHQTSSDDDEDLPPEDVAVPESVPISARKRLI